MSDTTEAATAQGRRESPSLAAVRGELEAMLDAGEMERVGPFTDLFLAKAPAELLRERGPQALARMAVEAFRFLEEAVPEGVHVGVARSGGTTVVRTVVSDRPFIVDTVRECIASQGLAIGYLIYPAPHVRRDTKGRIVEVRRAAPGEARHSFVHCEVAGPVDAAEAEALRAELELRLHDVVAATDDFVPMQKAADRVIAELGARAAALPARAAELEEIGAFLRWLRDGGFVLLGYRAYEVRETKKKREVCVEKGSGLGILRDEGSSTYAQAVPLDALDPVLRERAEGGPVLIISKTNAEATVHRRARMDYVGVKKLDAAGKSVGEHRFIGLFTSRAYAEDAEQIPILRDKLRRIIEAAGVVAGSHDFKEIKTIFNSMPKEELLLTSAEDIGADIRVVLTSYHAGEVLVTLREDSLHRGVSVMVIIPADRYSGKVRDEIEEVLTTTLEGELLNFHLALGGGNQARLHYYLSGHPDRFREVRADQLERAIDELLRSWTDRLRDGLERAVSSDEARRQAWRYGEAFSLEYQAATHPDVAVRDILELEAMEAEGRTLSVALSNDADMSWTPGDDKVTELKLYLRGDRLVLSDFMPILENAGLRVIAGNPFEVKGGGVPTALVYIFAVQDKEGRQLDVAERGAEVAQTILAVRAGDLTSDLLNGLVLATGLHWREVDVLRAYSTYAFQIGAVPARFALAWTLLKYPAIARQLFELFQIKFDPDSGASLDQRREKAKEAKAGVIAALTGVGLLADDRALRRMLTLVEATVRTNYYRSGGRVPTRRSGGVPYTSLKFACDAFQTVTKSRLMFEVWVRSSRMEGVHLRGAKVARGGIRWSDRMDDFRTEILGLVKTQMVKNAVIVPGGSKGGFVLLRPPKDPELIGEEGKEQYRTLIRGLLDVTDNLDPTTGALLPPERVVAFDEPDPYLVVAADKGTAKFSDVANAISAEYGFWLADAFASGGSHGYDHKTVGITAMGGWECVKRHFREVGKDIQTEPFTVVGVGDMSGDVFGNGMLLSRRIRLLAAFDHRHVFIDPDPDPEKSFKERERMFGLPRSSWADYDVKKLSKGGMIVPRGAKEVALAPAALAALGLPEGTGPMDGESLIRAVLRAPVELLWNGGIGTYVKSSEENHSDAGDPTNDAVRIDADALRCQVVGEGGNLGFTQQARIQYAQRGGRINTDALDNSGGVDLSDHEVNLKILLNPVVRSGQITQERRNELLEKLTEEVAALVLLDNRSQSRAISLDEARAKETPDDFRDLVTGLEKLGLLDRAAETLPTFEGITERLADGGTFTRPELCVLLAYSKLWLKAEVLKSELPDDPVLDGYLVNYFPAAAVAEAGDALRSHRLRREIVTTQLASDMVDLMGSAFVMRLARDTGRGAHEVARAWTVAARLSDHRALIKQMGSQGKPVPYAVAYRWLLGLARVLERTTRWVLQSVPSERATAQVIADFKEGIGALRGHFGELVAGEDRAIYEERVNELGELGADEALARDLITLRFLDQLLEILRVGKETDATPLDAARAYYRVSAALSVPWIRNAIFETAEEDRWEQRAAQAMADDLARAHHRLVAQVIRGRSSGGGDIDGAANQMMQSRDREVARYRALLEEIRGEPAMSLSGLSVAVREIASLSERSNGSG